MIDLDDDDNNIISSSSVHDGVLHTSNAVLKAATLLSPVLPEFLEGDIQGDFCAVVPLDL